MMPHSSFQLSFYLSVKLQYKSRPFGIAAVQREAAIHLVAMSEQIGRPNPSP